MLYMVRSSVYRVSKYDAKMVGDVVKNRIDAQRDSMVAQQSVEQPKLVAAEEATKALLNGWGVSVTLITSYLAFARRCLKITATHGADIALEELCIEHDKWEARGLDTWYMQEIAQAVVDVDISTCTG